jgi:hypothetical protein
LSLLSSRCVSREPAKTFLLVPTITYQLLGHKDLRIAALYQRLSPTFLSEAFVKLDAPSHASVIVPVVPL